MCSMDSYRACKIYNTNLPKVVPPTSSHSAPFLGTVIHYMLVLLTLQGSSYISSHFLALSKYRNINKHTFTNVS